MNTSIHWLSKKRTNTKWLFCCYCCNSLSLLSARSFIFWFLFFTPRILTFLFFIISLCIVFVSHRIFFKHAKLLCPLFANFSSRNWNTKMLQQFPWMQQKFNLMQTYHTKYTHYFFHTNRQIHIKKKHIQLWLSLTNTKRSALFTQTIRSSTKNSPFSCQLFTGFMHSSNQPISVLINIKAFYPRENEFHIAIFQRAVEILEYWDLTLFRLNIGLAFSHSKLLLFFFLCEFKSCTTFWSLTIHEIQVSTKPNSS